MLAAVGVIGGCGSSHGTKQQAAEKAQTSPVPVENAVSLGNFSVSLNVKDLAASRAFYEKLGFHMVGGQPAKNWVVLQNDTSTIGLFQGMFEKNSLTYNPGWDRSKKTLASFEDVRDLQKRLKERGLVPTVAADESTTGPAFFILTDPDGNPVLIDQHVPKPKK
jgi:catechol 2,3-dioxygenase-like lactoylglutathione lyase family enzyme